MNWKDVELCAVMRAAGRLALLSIFECIIIAVKVFSTQELIKVSASTKEYKATNQQGKCIL